MIKFGVEYAAGFDAGRKFAELEMSLWSDVDNEVPDDDSLVIIADADGVRVGCYDEGDWRCSQTGGRLYGVTHWMPLPEPPNV